MEHLPEPLWGQWYLGERLFVSSSTEVYALTRKEGAGRSCVLKCIRVPAGDTAGLIRLQDECRLQARMTDCGYAVAVLDDLTVPVTNADGSLRETLVCLRMERLACLAELMREGTELTETEIRRVAEDLLHALIFAHRLQIVHRDLKPANIYRAPSGQYKLGDFGICARTDSLSAGRMAGTAAYLAPEVAAGGAATPASDIYALGVTLYQLLNHNHLPLTDADSTYAQVQSSISARMRGVRVGRIRCRDRRLEKVVMRACEPDPRKRYPSAAAMLDALRKKPRAALPLALGACLASAALGFFAAKQLFSAQEDALPAEPEPPAVEAPAEPSAEAPAEVQTHRYEIIAQTLTWDDARVWCESRGGHLAAITSAEEAKTVEDMLDAAGITAVWLGANNRNASSGFQWVTGEPFDYAEWGPGEPNNTNGVEYYLMLMKRDGTGWVWNDSRLDGLNNFPENARGFLCEWEEASP